MIANIFQRLIGAEIQHVATAEPPLISAGFGDTFAGTLGDDADSQGAEDGSLGLIDSILPQDALAAIPAPQLYWAEGGLPVAAGDETRALQGANLQARALEMPAAAPASHDLGVLLGQAPPAMPLAKDLAQPMPIAGEQPLMATPLAANFTVPTAQLGAAPSAEQAPIPRPPLPRAEQALAQAASPPVFAPTAGPSALPLRPDVGGGVAVAAGQAATDHPETSRPQPNLGDGSAQKAWGQSAVAAQDGQNGRAQSEPSLNTIAPLGAAPLGAAPHGAGRSAPAQAAMLPSATSGAPLPQGDAPLITPTAPQTVQPFAPIQTASLPQAADLVRGGDSAAAGQTLLASSLPAPMLPSPTPQGEAPPAAGRSADHGPQIAVTSDPQSPSISPSPIAAQTGLGAASVSPILGPMALLPLPEQRPAPRLDLRDAAPDAPDTSQAAGVAAKAPSPVMSTFATAWLAQAGAAQAGVVQAGLGSSWQDLPLPEGLLAVDLSSGGALSMSASAPPTAAPNIPSPVASSLSAQLLPLVQAGPSGPVELVLSPAELGALRFEIQQSGDTVQIVLSAERPETQDLLRRHGDQLLQDFKNAGFAGASLSFGHWGSGAKNEQPAPIDDAPLDGAMPAVAATAADVFAAPIASHDPSRRLNLRL